MNWQHFLPPLGFDSYRPFLLALLFLPIVFVWSMHSLSGMQVTRRHVAVSLRCLTICLLLAALARPQLVRRVDDLTAVYMLDTSRSVSADLQKTAIDFVRESTKGMRAGKDRCAVLTFNGDVNIEQTASDTLNRDRFIAPARPHETNLEQAVRVACALFPTDTVRRLVLLSDGNQNIGDVTSELVQLAPAGVQVDVVPLAYRRDHDVIVEQLVIPVVASLDDTVTAHAILRSRQETTGRLVLYHNDVRVDAPSDATDAGRIRLSAGVNRMSFPLRLRNAGTHRFRVSFEPEDPSQDQIPLNNEVRAFTVVAGPQRMLILYERRNADGTPEGGSAQIVAEALRREGIECDVHPIGRMAIDAPSLMSYSTVVLSNVPALALPDAVQQSLVAYVRDLGGGLVVIGGDQSFSVGGYGSTPLESILPVETDRQKLNIPSLGMVMVIDRSGSMDGGKIEMARLAAEASVKLLNRNDHLAVLAFSGATDVVVPFALCDHKERIQRRIAGITVGGGTNMHPALLEAYNTLIRSSAGLKHVILLTDGQSMPGDFDALAKRMAQARITMSVVAVGADADRNLLQRLARITGGRMYHTDSPSRIPQIFAHETVLAGHGGLFERPFQPVLRNHSHAAITAGLDAGSVPLLNGHVVAMAKPQATVSMARFADGEDKPILAHWNVGLGRAVAFTSGMWRQWGNAWVSWSGFSKLWSQAVRWSAAPAVSTDLHASVSRRGTEATLLLETHKPVVANDLRQLTATVAMPDGGSVPIPVQRVGPGRYSGTFQTPDLGDYVIRAAFQAGEGAAARSGHILAGLSVSYSAEWRDYQSNEALLTDIARRTNGRLLQSHSATEVFGTDRIIPVETRRPIWDWLVWLGMLAFVLDVAVRRLAVRPMEVWARLLAALRGLRPAAVSAGVETTLASLKELRGRPQRDQSVEPAQRGEADTQPSTEPTPARHEPTRQPAVRKPASATVASDESPLASRLLRKRQPARGKTADRSDDAGQT